MSDWNNLPEEILAEGRLRLQSSGQDKGGGRDINLWIAEDSISKGVDGCREQQGELKDE